MKITFRRSFERDLRRIRDQRLKQRIRTIIEHVEAADTLAHINNLSTIKGRQNFYRIRIGDYRIGIVAENDEIEFVRCLHRREIYRYFP